MSQAAAVSTTNCPAVPLLREALALIPDIRLAQAAAYDGPDAHSIAALDRLQALHQALNVIHDRTSRIAPDSAAGAMFQVHIIAHLAELLDCLTPSGAAGDASDEAVRTIYRLCASVRAYLEVSSCAMTAEDAGAAFYLPRHFDPPSAFDETIPVSATGAMFQIQLISAMAGLLGAASGDEDAEGAAAMISRLCASVRAYLEMVSTEGAADAGKGLRLGAGAAS